MQRLVGRRCVGGQLSSLDTAEHLEDPPTWNYVRASRTESGKVKEDRGTPRCGLLMRTSVEHSSFTLDTLTRLYLPPTKRNKMHSRASARHRLSSCFRSRSPVGIYTSFQLTRVCTACLFNLWDRLLKALESGNFHLRRPTYANEIRGI
ncbi:hypothetical protein KM043_015900 [Ampulex compressa]|nr:hypothetical protein KM043_015900 [Ampulex compressa]